MNIFHDQDSLIKVLGTKLPSVQKKSPSYARVVTANVQKRQGLEGIPQTRLISSDKESTTTEGIGQKRKQNLQRHDLEVDILRKQRSNKGIALTAKSAEYNFLTEAAITKNKKLNHLSLKLLETVF